MDVITLIVQFAQEIEHPDLWKTLSIYRFHKEDPTETLRRIRALLKRGLVSKLWQDVISDPTLWTMFLNASMAEDQFIRVVARSGNLPVAVRFKAQKYSSLSDNTVRAITSKSPSITGLMLDISNATPSPIGPTFHLRTLMNLLRYSMPALCTLSLFGGNGSNSELSALLSSETAFGGVAPPIQHLELSGIMISPPTFSTTLVSLSLVFKDLALMHSQLSPWARLAQQGDTHALKELILRAPPHEANDELQISSDSEKVPIPSTLDKLVIEGDIPSCLYMGSLLRHPIPVTFSLFVWYETYDSEYMSLLVSLYAQMRAYTKSKVLEVEITEDKISFTTIARKDATLTLVPIDHEDAGYMLCSVMSEFGSGLALQDLYDLRGAPVFEKAWVTLDLVLHRHTLLGIHDDDEVPQILECFSAFFQGLEDIKNVQIAQYVILGDDSSELDPWEDTLRLFQRHHPEDSTHRSALLFPNLKTLRIVEPAQGVSREFHREISDFTWEHVQSQSNQDKGAGFEHFEILLLSGDLVGIKYDSMSALSHEDWDVLCTMQFESEDWKQMRLSVSPTSQSHSGNGVPEPKAMSISFLTPSYRRVTLTSLDYASIGRTRSEGRGGFLHGEIVVYIDSSVRTVDSKWSERDWKDFIWVGVEFVLRVRDRRRHSGGHTILFFFRTVHQVPADPPLSSFDGISPAVGVLSGVRGSVLRISDIVFEKDIGKCDRKALKGLTSAVERLQVKGLTKDNDDIEEIRERYASGKGSSSHYYSRLGNFPSSCNDADEREIPFTASINKWNGQRTLLGARCESRTPIDWHHQRRDIGRRRALKDAEVTQGTLATGPRRHQDVEAEFGGAACKARVHQFRVNSSVLVWGVSDSQ
ncbi:hypothetical protein FA13DRAFT_1718548 [Coprinellus micaceus]|uniref:Uncharacterized protein n=1 Tax=Coprinellus micaceus TaxID=71717 RepID=A0A4Y7SDD8_COPMI|nr:hypothetical protein FA13DRAFT_1718548 [Coprinellus micaceus]